MPVRYRTAADAEAERLAADRLGELMQCEVHAFPPLTPIDWYACRHDALVAYLEVKTRSHRHDAFGTVYLSVRKWLALELAELAQGVPGIFVVQWVDALGWIRTSRVDAHAVTIAGNGGTTEHGRNGIEPIILVPVDLMAVTPHKAAPL
jgi:hypothetical protein